MNEKEIQDIIYDIRTWYFETLGVKIPLSKRLNLDLLVKYCILCFNSIGKSNCGETVFLDEVVNKNMSDNLRDSIRHCAEPFSVMTFFSKEKTFPHVKVGYIYPILIAFQALLKTIGHYLMFPFRGIEKTRRSTSDCLERMFVRYLRRLYGKAISIYCMTDHNFYSTIACVDNNFFSSVIQHGLWLSDEIGEQVLADRICVWGERSKEIIKTNKRKDITGTYKFDKLLEYANNTTRKAQTNGRTLLYCISSLDQNVVTEKLNTILEKSKKYKYTLKVKTHPGFGFPLEELQNHFPGVEFYKECLLLDIDFDIGVCENSSVILDILCLGKKYIIYDTDSSYFGIYENIIPWAKSSEQLDILLRNIDDYNYTLASSAMIKNELNNNVCTLFKT